MDKALVGYILLAAFALGSIEACPPATCVYKNANGTQVKECTCPPGKIMALHDNIYRCFDRCSSCPNGMCIDGLCHCFQNHFRNSNGACEPICKGCKNGWCSSPFKCECNPGYGGSNCSVKCPGRCDNGYCSSSGDCVCNQGYKLVSEDRCESLCPRGCPNGVCVGPEKCLCHHGYSLSSSKICEPNCSNCQNGVCKAPGKCECNPGYIMTASGGCEPTDCVSNLIEPEVPTM